MQENNKKGEGETKHELIFKKACYKIGKANGWTSGRYAREDGDFIAPEDCFNENSFIKIHTREELYKAFERGNWTLGQAFLFGDLCFIQQVDGGDEWLTIKNFPNGVKDFESISFGRMIEGDKTDGTDDFNDTINELSKINSPKDYWSR